MTTSGLLHAIDFGTSSSAIVVSEPDGTLTAIPDPAETGGSLSVRTSLCVQRDGTIAIGAAAERIKVSNPAAYRGEFKRDFGNPVPTSPGGIAMTADEMTTEVLRFLREQAQQAIPGDPDLVTITVPAGWEDGNRKLMHKAARRAGYRCVIELIPEPVAALGYVFGQQRDPAERLTVLVYDLGGGTFDCALARGTADGHEVLGKPDGLDDAAGAEFDRRLLGLLRDRFPEAMANLDGATAGEVDPLRRLLTLQDTCERMKWQLSRADSAEELLTELQPSAWFTVTRSDFEGRIRPLLAQTVTICDQMLSGLRMKWTDVDRVVPVGGSSRIPLVGKLLAERCECPVLAVDNPELAVVYGAALLGRDLLADQAERTVYVNGRRKTVPASRVSFDDVVGLALVVPAAANGTDRTITVTYERAAGRRAAGSLAEGMAVQVRDGTIFNVTATDKS